MEYVVCGFFQIHGHMQSNESQACQFCVAVTWSPGGRVGVSYIVRVSSLLFHSKQLILFKTIHFF